MKTFFRISSKKVLMTASISVLGLFILFFQENVLEGKSATKTLATSTPLSGAKLVLTKIGSSSSPAQATLSVTTGSDGKFSFPNIVTSARGSGMITYKLTVTQVTPSVLVSVTFNQQRGLTAGGAIANTGPIGPFSFSSKDSLMLGVAMGGVISGTITK